MTEERIPEKMLPTKMEGKRPRERPRTKWIDEIGKDIEMREERNGKKYKKTGSGRFLCSSRPTHLERRRIDQ